MKNELKLIALAIFLVLVIIAYTLFLNKEVENTKNELNAAAEELAIDSYNFGWSDGFRSAVNLRKDTSYTRGGIDRMYKKDSVSFTKIFQENAR